MVVIELMWHEKGFWIWLSSCSQLLYSLMLSYLHSTHDSMVGCKIINWYQYKHRSSSKVYELLDPWYVHAFNQHWII